MSIAELFGFLAVLAGVAWLLWYSPLSRDEPGDEPGAEQRETMAAEGHHEDPEPTKV